MLSHVTQQLRDRRDRAVALAALTAVLETAGTTVVESAGYDGYSENVRVSSLNRPPMRTSTPCTSSRPSRSRAVCCPGRTTAATHQRRTRTPRQRSVLPRHDAFVAGRGATQGEFELSTAGVGAERQSRRRATDPVQHPPLPRLLHHQRPGYRHRRQNPPPTPSLSKSTRTSKTVHWRTCPRESSPPTRPGWSWRPSPSTSRAPSAPSPAPTWAKARSGTIRRKLITVTARIATSARKTTLHLPAQWPWETSWSHLFEAACGHHGPPLSDYPADSAQRGPWNSTGSKAGNPVMPNYRTRTKIRTTPPHQNRPVDRG